MNKIRLIATSAFGLEKIVKREVETLGFENIEVADGRVEFDALLKDIPKANIWLRCADRVLIKLAEFSAGDFDEFFDGVKRVSWGGVITKDGKITVKAKTSKSALASPRACQSIAKKAIVESLKEKYNRQWFKETGPEFIVGISVLKNTVLLTLDTSGAGLHKRGYRGEAGEAPLKETLAAGLVMLSFWDKDRILIDPMCGSGTILIEAAMIARNIAPGLKRTFAGEKWPLIDKRLWDRERASAEKAVKVSDERLRVFGYDIDERSVQAAKKNAKAAGVADDIFFEKKDIGELWIDKQYGIVITNPPYGIRMSGIKELHQMYISINKTFRKKKGWSVYVLTADKEFPNYFKRLRPDRVRKLYNGKIQTNYYQYYGERP